MKILTANELLSGATVYLDAQGRWEKDLQSARIFAQADEADLEAAIKAAGQTGRLVSVESEEIEQADGKIVPQRLRERIRAQGPTSPRHEPKEMTEGDHVSL